jgi:hypothetical protein
MKNLNIYKKLESVVDDQLDIDNYFDFDREGDMKRDHSIEVYHLCQDIELIKRNQIEFAAENTRHGLIKY